jgi:hypothetical protein
MNGQRRGLLGPLGFPVEHPSELRDLVIGEVGAVALPWDAEALFEGVDDILVGHADFFGELIDAKHEGAYLSRRTAKKTGRDVSMITASQRATH